MFDHFTHKLAGYDLDQLSIVEAPFSASDFPSEDQISQTLAGAWSDLFAMFSGNALESDAEDIAWAFVNLFHRAAQRKSRDLDRASDELRALLASADGSEIQTAKLEEQIERAQAAEASMASYETMREVAASLYIHETGSSWKPMNGSRANTAAKITSAVVNGRDFLATRKARQLQANAIEGTPVIFAGGRCSFAEPEHAKSFGSSVWDTLDKVRANVPDMVLVHGGDTKGADRLAASWAEQRSVQQVTFGLERHLGARAGFKRNEHMLSLDPRYVVAFPGNGVLERLVIDAKARNITVVDRRGPLGTKP